MRLIDTDAMNEELFYKQVGGSSLIAYEEYGLEYVGYEINEDYYNDARKRLEEFRSQITLFDLGMEEHK